MMMEIGLRLLFIFFDVVVIFYWLSYIFHWIVNEEFYLSFAHISLWADGVKKNGNTDVLMCMEWKKEWEWFMYSWY